MGHKKGVRIRVVRLKLPDDYPFGSPEEMIGE